MADLAIQVRGLGKEYRIGRGQKRANTLRDAIRDRFASLPGLLQAGRAEAASTRAFWALEDISFDVKRGEVIGVIGRNGAGKSTLLKILARITEPSLGEADIYGRVGSLLEVGTGFHAELTGRENIFLNGAILGMRRREVQRKFDDIVAFADIPRFIDTAVKHYSSGMYMRLAFAVAAHLETEILLVDEVLAVGDGEFQKKCLGKISDVARAGRTVLFVSHQLNSVRKLCDSCLWIDRGHMAMIGPATDIVNAYEASANERQARPQGELDGKSGVRFLDWTIGKTLNDETWVLRNDGPVALRLSVQLRRSVTHGMHEIYLWNADHQIMWSWVVQDLALEPGVHEFAYSLPGLPLRPGAYSWEVGLSENGEVLEASWLVPDLLVATPALVHSRDEFAGVLNIPCTFQTQRLP